MATGARRKLILRMAEMIKDGPCLQSRATQRLNCQRRCQFLCLPLDAVLGYCLLLFVSSQIDVLWRPFTHSYKTGEAGSALEETESEYRQGVFACREV